ncbi:hypothetical protein B9Z55_017392 [Caenorhabditis nigoni]|uniref:G-protein coupled receptors family 1 profile domain-containing protein n=1 Tax=Caenorhabditis nigoni TaxID=1611254 RepID=A0A2G5T8X6_9PELO|nr:hypothetical protein B9Z55_017392 [Caenorhabditis nigoni]
MVLIFFIALNRCLVIVKSSWSEAIFEGKRVIVPVIISLVVSILGAYLSIRTSKIKRRYQIDIGFIDFGEPNGFRKLIARIFYIFPLASAICYLIIFYHLKMTKKKLLSHNNLKNKGQQNVFIQILITVFFYGGSFYFLLITLAISVLLRTIIFIITLIFATFADDTLSYSIPTTISLYTDAISENFSIVLIFFISLNRCLIIVKNQWNDAIFEGKRVIVPIIISISISVLGAYLSIRTSKITRKYDSDMGFIDFGEPNGFKKLIARLFYIFPLASAICYLIIFIYLKKRKKILLSQNNSNNKGQQNVFIQILITVFFYGVLQKVLEPQMLFSMLSDNVSNFRILGIH